MESPYQSYENPTAVLVDKSISQDEKIRILQQWCEDEEALLRASAEGMEGGERPHLKEAQLALDGLRNSAA